MPRLEFLPDVHEYRIDGMRIPSVTGIMRTCSLTVDYAFADKIHAFRGTAVHHGCALIDQGGSPWFEVGGQMAGDPEYVKVANDINTGYLPAYRAFKERTGFQGRIYECVMVHEALRFGGTFDAVGEAGDEVWLIDLKSGVLPELVSVQLAAYEMLIRHGVPVDSEHPGLEWLREVVKSGRKIHRKAVRLERDGTDTLFSQTSKGCHYDSRTFDTAWSAAISIYNLRATYNLL